MSGFHTKTIESILEPVAQQVSRLVILHEEAEDGNAMPDLSRPVQGVSKAVVNLVKVGKETVQSSDDPILRQDMPTALHRLEKASKLLEEASALFAKDPYSQPARKKLIQGAKGIMQDTYSVLLAFDESEVRKIIGECKKVLDYLAVAEVIENMTDLVQFVKDLSPCLTKVSREVDAREKELVHQAHRDILVRSLESVKSLSPILICSMKIFVQILSQGGKGVEDAAENRNYLAVRMSDEINEIIRVLLLTNYDEEAWDADNLTVMKKALNAIDGKLATAHDFLEDPNTVVGGVGEKSMRYILDYAKRIADRCLPPDSQAIHKMCGDITAMTNALCELRTDGKGSSAPAEALSRGISQKLRELIGLVSQGITNVERNSIQQPAHTLTGRMEQARTWLNNPSLNDKGLGFQAVQSIIDDARKIANSNNCPLVEQLAIQKLCSETENLARQLSDMCRHGQGNSYEALTIAQAISGKLQTLKSKVQETICRKVVKDFIDISTPLKQFTDAVLSPEGTPNRELNFIDKAGVLTNISQLMSNTARSVATGGSANKKLAEMLLSSANQVESLTPQLVNAGRIRMSYPDNKAADDHFENLRRQYSESVHKMRALADEATDTLSFIKMSEDSILKHTQACEDSIANHDPQKMVENTSSIARLANRVLMVAKQESDNSEDPFFVARVNEAAEILQSTVTPMVQDAKMVALNIHDAKAVNCWRTSNKALIAAVGQVHYAVMATPDFPPDIPPPPDMNMLNLNDEAPPRPPLPASEDAFPPPRPPPPETDDEDFEVQFPVIQPNQPIMVAARGLHEEVRQYSSKDNELIAAAKKMALLMGKLSQLTQGDGGSKRELIACAKDIAEASKEVTRLAKELARMCTDKRMRTNILQVCERIPTIGTQLRILSTVKATMLAGQGTDEDLEATEMLVGNAQNLMQSVKETVRACEAASIKIRTDSGIRVRWIRKQPWYQY
ncbi:vinculin isoform X2 [Parasteatoda tepidariorum]|uniref:vinculin isoform X2 n=1 Tax=Parasteatoda tepidariorum TaxID=114398 RepID=UPI000A2BFFA6|nr:vinculin isoform X2 [Parasteatoda tepidariorum]